MELDLKSEPNFSCFFFGGGGGEKKIKFLKRKAAI